MRKLTHIKNICTFCYPCAFWYGWITGRHFKMLFFNNYIYTHSLMCEHMSLSDCFFYWISESQSKVHLNLMSSLWVFTWVDSLFPCGNAFPQISHVHGRSFVCVSTYLFRQLFVVNFLWQRSHWWGHTSVWVLTWSIRWCHCLKALWQTVHIYLISSWPVNRSNK